eukprot:scaffold13561_cov50-Prasinocladus_malaysianus.AAC.1
MHVSSHHTNLNNAAAACLLPSCKAESQGHLVAILDSDPVAANCIALSVIKRTARQCITNNVG